MKLYGGIDLHSNNHVVVLSDADGKEVYRKRLANDLKTTLGAAALPDAARGGGRGVQLQLLLAGGWINAPWLSRSFGEYRRAAAVSGPEVFR